LLPTSFWIVRPRRDCWLQHFSQIEYGETKSIPEYFPSLFIPIPLAATGFLWYDYSPPPFPAKKRFELVPLPPQPMWRLFPPFSVFHIFWDCFLDTFFSPRSTWNSTRYSSQILVFPLFSFFFFPPGPLFCRRLRPEPPSSRKTADASMMFLLASPPPPHFFFPYFQ